MYSQVTNITASAMGTLYQTAVTNAIGQGTVEMHVGHAYNYYNIRGMIDELKMKNNGYFTSKQIEYIFRKERAGQDPF
jgi:hypothetical protein